MGSDNKSAKQTGGAPAAQDGHDSPDWAAGLRQLYDSVVEEELPDTFKNLLAELDEGSNDSSSVPHNGPKL